MARIAFQIVIIASAINLIIAYEYTLFQTSDSLVEQVCNDAILRLYSIQSNSVSAIGCAYACAKHRGCFGSWYHEASTKCYGCYPNVNPALLTSSHETGGGARFHRRVPKGRSCSLDPLVTAQNLTSLNLGTAVYDFLVSGYLAVPDAHLTASSNWAADWAGVYSVRYGRLCREPGYDGAQIWVAGALNTAQWIQGNRENTVRLGGLGGVYNVRYDRLCREPGYGGAQVWAAGVLDTAQWIQVRFLGDSDVIAVVTGGRVVGNSQYVTAYTVLHSTDCSQFTPVVNADSTTKVFAGNVDSTSLVYNVLQQPVTALCIRINPVTWYGFLSMRFDVIGHTP